MRRKSIFVVGVALLLFLAVGAVSAQELSDEAPRGNWDTTESTGEIILDSQSYYRVYQGEGDITRWRNVNGDDATNRVLTRTPDADILELRRSIPADQRVGMYESNDGELTALVVRPRVSRVNLYNRLGSELSRDAAVRRSSPLLVQADWNFVEAEDLRIRVIDSGGTEVTREVLTTEISDEQAEILPGSFSESFLNRPAQGVGSTDHSTAYWAVDPDDLRAGTHEIRVEGVDDLNFGAARDTVRLSVGDVRRPSLRFDTTTLSRG